MPVFENQFLIQIKTLFSRFAGPMIHARKAINNQK